MSNITIQLKDEIHAKLQKLTSAQVGEMADNLELQYQSVAKSIHQNSPCLTEYRYFSEVARVLNLEPMLEIVASMEQFLKFTPITKPHEHE